MNCEFKLSERPKLQELVNACHFKNSRTWARAWLLGSDPMHSNAGPPCVHCCSISPNLSKEWKLLQVMSTLSGQELVKEILK